jgi:glutathione S-transferase
MEKRLGEVEYIAGAHYTLADIGFQPYIEYLFAAGHGELITSRPHVAAWWNKISTRPSWLTATGKTAAA